MLSPASLLRRIRPLDAPRIARLFSSASGPAEDFDIVIVGGGVAGSAFAASIQCAHVIPTPAVAR